MGLHTQAQCFQTLKKNPGVKRTHGGTCSAQKRHHLIHMLLAANYGPTHTAPLTIQIFCCRVHNDIGSQGQGQLQRGGTETVIYH